MSKKTNQKLAIVLAITGVISLSGCSEDTTTEVKTEVKKVVEAKVAEVAKVEKTTAPTAAEIEAKILTKYPAIDIAMEAKKLAEHTYQIQGVAGIATDNGGFISNAGFVVTDAGVVVVDTLGSPPLAIEMLKQIRKVTDKPIVKAIITHYHADHLYGAQVFQELGAEVIAPIGSMKYVNADSAPARLAERRESLKPWVNEQTYIVTPDKIIDKTTDFSLGGQDFTINVVGAAHSDGDLTLHAKEDGVLFSGDIIFGGRVPFIGGGSTSKWVETLAGMESGLKLNLLVPGHGDASNNPAAAIKLTKGYLQYMREVMGSAVEEMEEFVDAYEDTDWSTYEEMPAFGNVNRLNANTVFLSMEEESVE